MSSILRALKKLEEDPVSPEHPAREQEKKIKQAITRGNRSPQLNMRLLFIIPVILLTGAATWIIINNSLKNQSPTPPDYPGNQPPLTGLSQPLPSPTVKKELKKEPQKEVKPTPTPQKQSQPIEKPAIQEIAPPPPTGTHEITKPLQPLVDNPVTHPPTPTRESVKKSHHPEFIFNGVLWSEKPGRRIALINERYLKEGDTIDGVLVVKIEKKSVTLQYGEETWTLKVK